MTIEVENNSHDVNKTVKDDFIIPQTNKVFLAVETLTLKKRINAYILYQIEKNGAQRQYFEHYQAPYFMEKDTVMFTVLYKAAAILNSKSGTVFYTFDGLDNSLPRPRGNVTFERIAPADNPTFEKVQQIYRQAFTEAHK